MIFKKGVSAFLPRNESSWHRYYKQEKGKMAFFKVIKCGIPSIPSLRGGALLRVRNIA
jgi:hypothetical protein